MRLELEDSSSSNVHTHTHTRATAQLEWILAFGIRCAIMLLKLLTCFVSCNHQGSFISKKLQSVSAASVNRQ